MSFEKKTNQLGRLYKNLIKRACPSSLKIPNPMDAHVLPQKKIEQQIKNGVLYLIAKLRTSWHDKNKIEIQIAMLNLADQ